MVLIRIRFLLALFFFLASPIILHAHKTIWDVTLFGPEHDLPNNKVRDIVQAEDGAVYIATWGEGVWVIHPDRWAIRQLNTQFQYDSVRALTLDALGRVWSGSSVGLSCYQGERVIHFDHGTEDDNSIISLYASDDGSIWVGTTGRIFVYDGSMNDLDDLAQTKNVVLDRDITKGNSVHDIIETADGTVWALIEDLGLYRYDGNRWDAFGQSLPSITSACCLEVDTKGQLWVLTHTHLHCYGFPGWESEETPVSNNNAFLITSTGALVLGTDEGLWLKENGSWNRFDPDRKLGRLSVETCFRAYDGSILLGTERGLARLYSTCWETITHPNKEEVFYPEAISIHSQSPPLVVDRNGSLFRFQENQWQLIYANVFDQKVHDITQSRGERVWVLLDGKIEIFPMQTPFDRERIPLPEAFEPVAVISKDTRPAYVVGKYSIYAIDPDKALHLEWRSAGSIIQCVALTSDSSLWIGLENGLIRVVNGKVAPFPTVHEDMLEEKVLAIMETTQGEFWVGTSADGLFVLRGGEWNKYPATGGPRESRIHCLYQASNGIIWTGSIDNRISNYHNDDWIHFAPTIGPASWEVKNIGEYPAGTLWFLLEGQGRKSLLRYQPLASQPETHILAGPEEYNSYTYGLFHFIGNDVWHHTAQSDLVYSWQVKNLRDEGIAHPWSAYTANTTLRLSSLPPGSYQLQVRARNRHRVEDATPAKIPFTVLGPMWTRPSFYIPLAILGLATLGLLVQNYKRQQTITRMAYYDVLTGLPNRMLFMDRAKMALAQMQRQHQLGAIVFMDMDGFKEVNDRHGHAAGDEVLRAIAQRLRAALRQTDTIARFGGDEFVILLSEVTTLDAIPNVVRKIQGVFETPFVYHQAKLFLGASIGVSIYPTHATNIDTLLKLADDAMYEAKHANSKGFRIAGNETIND